MSDSAMNTVFEIEMDVRWGDMDAFNHVNNASYLRYIEEARVLWFKQISPVWADPDCSPILAAAQMNYRRPIGWPERLRIAMGIERLGGKSLTIGHRIESATQPGVRYADGHTVLVWAGRDGSAMPLPKFVLRACGA